MMTPEELAHWKYRLGAGEGEAVSRVIAVLIVLAGLLTGCGPSGAPEHWYDVQRPYDHKWMHCYIADRGPTCDWDHPWT